MRRNVDLIKIIYYLNWIWTPIFISYNIVFFTYLEKIQSFKIGYQVLVWFFVIISWLSLCILSFGAGYPNNKPDKIIHLDSTRNKNKSLTIQVKEIEKSKCQIFDSFYNEVFDMRGWVKQKRFISTLIKTKLMLDIYNREKPKESMLWLGNQYSLIKELSLIFIPLHGKESKKIIIKNHRIVKSFHLRLKSYFISRHRGIKAKYIEYSLSDFYYIKKKT